MPPSETWIFALLRPLRALGAEAANAGLLGPSTLGIEVTEPELAARCRLGVIDPQHGPRPADGAAIEAALDWPLPSKGARLVTIRADADAIGAMAVLALRADGARLGGGARERIAFIGRWDGFIHGSWRDFVAERGPLPRPARVDDVRLFPPQYAAMASIAADRGRPLAARVAVFRRWLVTGDIPQEALADAERAAEALAQAWNEGDLEIGRAEDAPLAIVRGPALGGLALGYRFAPVVIAQAAGFACADGARKVTIAQFAPGHADLAGLARALNGTEPGWGGSPTIIGSPQGVGTRLPLHLIETVARDHIVRNPTPSPRAGCVISSLGRGDADGG